MAKQSKDETIQIEETKTAVHDGIERVRELISEAKLRLRQRRAETLEPKPPNPAS